MYCNFKHSICIILVCLSVSTVWTGCATKVEDNAERMISRDLSRSGIDSLTIDEVYEMIMESTGLSEPEGVVYGGIKVRLTYVGDISRYPYITVKLPPAVKYWDNSQQREKDIQQFKDDLREALAEWLVQPADQGFSQIYCGVAGQLAELNKSDFATDKRYILYSDGFQADNRVRFENYRYKENVLKDSIPAFYEMLEAECPMPESLAGINVKIVNSLVWQNDALARATGKFWELALVSRGSTLEIRSK